MKTSILIVMVTASLTLGAWAQDKAGASSSDQARVGTASKPLTVSGKVTSDGKALVTDLDSEWTISNPETLKGLEGLRVSVKCYVDTEKNRIQVLRVKKEDGELKSASRHGDSAFRR